MSFGQVKGSYHKLKIKDTPENATPGQLCTVEIAKVTQEKVVSTFVEWVEADDGGEAALKERHYA